MTLGERCDEILRLIDETLADLTAAPAPTPALVPRPGQAEVRRRG